jgi:hypothetical protein
VTAVHEDLEAAKKMTEQLQEEREQDLLRRNDYLKSTTVSLEKSIQEAFERPDMLNEQVKQWTEWTYE